MDVEFIPITIDDTISYNWKHEHYGRAEFTFCPVFNVDENGVGVLKELYIQARQQEREVIGWKFTPEIPVEELQFSSWTHKTEHPFCWMHRWCKHHKTLMHMIYVPPNTNQISFRYHFGDHLTIQFE